MESRIEDLYVGDDFYARGEYAGGFLFFHCELYIHNKSTIKKIRQALRETIEQAREMGYDKPVFSYVEEGPKGKLSKLAGGVLCNTFEAEGKRFEVYKWE